MGRRYRLLLTSCLISSFGDWLYRVTIPLLVLHLTGSAMQTGAVYAIEYVPFLVFSLPGGLLADRLERRRILLYGDLTAAVIAGALGLVVAQGRPSLVAVYALAFFLACVEPVHHPAFQSIIPDLVPAARLPAANARLLGGDNVVTFAGPVLAGGIVSFAGYKTTIFIDAATFLLSAVLVSMITGVPEREQAKDAEGRRLSEAVRYVRGNRILIAGALAFAAFNLFIWMIQANFVYYVTKYQHFGPELVGLMVGLQGAGAVFGAIAAGRLLGTARPGLVITWSNAVMGVLVLFLVLVRGPAWIGLTWTLLFGFGAAANVAWFTLRQQIVPGAMLGRAVALTRMVAFASIPVAALLSGAIESRLHDLYLLMTVVGVGNLVTAFAARSSPLTAKISHPVASP